jgi:hypothetical protein
MVATAPSASADAAPACTFNGSSTPIVQDVQAGSQVVIACTGLPALRPYLLLQASLLIGIDPTAAGLLAGGSPGPGTITGALAALPLIDAGSFSFPTSDLNGDLNYTYTVPTIQPSDPNASCPPSQTEFNAGLIGCALAMVDLETQLPLAAGSGVLEYEGFPLLPPDPTLALSAKKAKAGDVLTASDAPGATTYWWVATLASLVALLSGGGAPADTFAVNFERGRHGAFIPATNTLTVAPASYDGTTLTLPSLSGSITVPAGVGKGKNAVYAVLSANLEGQAIVNVGKAHVKIKK